MYSYQCEIIMRKSDWLKDIAAVAVKYWVKNNYNPKG